MPDLAKKVTVDLREKKLYVDGAEFPWFISDDGVSLPSLGASNAIQAVTLTFFADDVEVIPADSKVDA